MLVLVSFLIQPSFGLSLASIVYTINMICLQMGLHWFSYAHPLSWFKRPTHVLPNPQPSAISTFFLYFIECFIALSTICHLPCLAAGPVCSKTWRYISHVSNMYALHICNVYMYIYICIYICMYVYMYVWLRLHMYTYTYIYVYIWS